jgi:hypothetical protein
MRRKVVEREANNAGSGPGSRCANQTSVIYRVLRFYNSNISKKET